MCIRVKDGKDFVVGYYLILLFNIVVFLHNIFIRIIALIKRYEQK